MKYDSRGKSRTALYSWTKARLSSKARLRKSWARRSTSVLNVFYVWSNAKQTSPEVTSPRDSRHDVAPIRMQRLPDVEVAASGCQQDRRWRDLFRPADAPQRQAAGLPGLPFVAQRVVEPC